MKILIAEDAAHDQLVLARSVARLGHEPVLVSDGEAALERVGSGARLVISDWRMPRLDGMELCRRIRARVDAPYVYFILLTDFDGAKANQELAAVAGVDDFLSKPVDESELWRRLRVALRVLDYMTQLRQLEEFLPICGYCKKIRDDKNYWQQIERYLSERTGTAFSHSICPECYQQHVAPQFSQLGLNNPPAGGGAP